MNPKLDEAKRILGIADHMAYVSYSVINEPRLLIKMLEQINLSLNNLILTILDNEYEQRRARQYSDDKENMRTFLACAGNYGFKTSDIEMVKSIKRLMELHSQSSMEFVKEDKFVILSDSIKLESITLDRIKGYISMLKQAIKETEAKIGIDRASMAR